MFYAPNPYRAKSYIEILQLALENCRDLPEHEDVLDYVRKKSQVKAVAEL